MAKKVIKAARSDFDPTQVGLAVAILASVSLVLLALIAMRS